MRLLLSALAKGRRLIILLPAVFVRIRRGRDKRLRHVGLTREGGLDDDCCCCRTECEDAGRTASHHAGGALFSPSVPSPATVLTALDSQPMYIILNLGISDSFQRIDYSGLTVRSVSVIFLAARADSLSTSAQFPAHMLIDYVRVYQQEGKESITCDPDSHPTAQYIEECV